MLKQTQAEKVKKALDVMLSVTVPCAFNVSTNANVMSIDIYPMGINGGHRVCFEAWLDFGTYERTIWTDDKEVSHHNYKDMNEMLGLIRLMYTGGIKK